MKFWHGIDMTSGSMKGCKNMGLDWGLAPAIFAKFLISCHFGTMIHMRLLLAKEEYTPEQLLPTLCKCMAK